MSIEAVAITSLLVQWRSGDRQAESALAKAIYPILRQVAQSQLRKHGHEVTLSATDLAQDAYIKLREQYSVDWKNREHFFAIAATVVRRVVIDYLRERYADKRGGGKIMVDVHSMAENEAASDGNQAIDWIALDAALDRLAAMDPECARVVEMKLFTPMTAEQIADVCSSSVATVGRHWRFARHWLASELDEAGIKHAE
ncbi:ECF-type sigma factor [Ahniella affigens]|nr:ECF-type sigma factor [Ahniella affigens]